MATGRRVRHTIEKLLSITLSAIEAVARIIIETIVVVQV